MINHTDTATDDRNDALRAADDRHALIMNRYQGLKFEANDRPADRTKNHSRGARKSPTHKFVL